jgi:putative membrane protein
MLADAAFAFFHFAALIMMVGALFGELYLMRLPVTAQTIPLLARIDRTYGISAGALIAAGLGRVYFGLKDESFYFSSHAFAAKMAVFITVGVISVWPTTTFLRWNKAVKADANFVPPEAQVKSVRTQIRVQAVLLGLIVLFAVLMARGIG